MMFSRHFCSWKATDCKFGSSCIIHFSFLIKDFGLDIYTQCDFESSVNMHKRTKSTHGKLFH